MRARMRAAALLLQLGCACGQILCGTQQDFSPERFIVHELESGAHLNQTLCPRQWSWARMKVQKVVRSSRLTQSGNRWLETPTSMWMSHAAAISVDTGWDPVGERYMSVSLLVVNGTPPDYAKVEPYVEADYAEIHHAWAPITDRETLALGYNASSEVGCQLHLDEYVYMGVRCLASIGGTPCDFNLTATALPFELYGAVVAARGAGGDGFTCCGGIKAYLAPSVPPHLSLRAEVKVTHGAARAVWLRHQRCPVYPDDVEGEVCTGKCVVRWLTVYDEYDGAARTHGADVALVPTGLEPGSVDLRGEGDWYIGVQANDGEEAHYELSVSLVEPPPQPQRVGCDGYEHFCAPPFAEESAAPRRAHASASLLGSGALAAAAALAAGAAAAAPRRSRDRRRRHGPNGFK